MIIDYSIPGPGQVKIAQKVRNEVDFPFHPQVLTHSPAFPIA